MLATVGGVEVIGGATLSMRTRRVRCVTCPGVSIASQPMVSELGPSPVVITTLVAPGISPYVPSPSRSHESV